MAYNVVTGEIAPDRLYSVSGTVVYNAIARTDTTFRGVAGVSTFTGSGVVTELIELRGASAEFSTNDVDAPVSYIEETIIKGMAVEFELNAAEYVVNDVTEINGFALELIDYPFYCFTITETRL